MLGGYFSMVPVVATQFDFHDESDQSVLPRTLLSRGRCVFWLHCSPHVCYYSTAHQIRRPYSPSLQAWRLTARVFNSILRLQLLIRSTDRHKQLAIAKSNFQTIYAYLLCSENPETEINSKQYFEGIFRS